jgi:hypothetical protein
MAAPNRCHRSIIHVRRARFLLAMKDNSPTKRVELRCTVYGLARVDFAEMSSLALSRCADAVALSLVSEMCVARVLA